MALVLAVRNTDSLHHRQVQLPVGRRQQEAAERTHRRRLGRRGQADHDGAQHRQDQDQQREEARQQHLEDLEPLEAQHRVEAEQRERTDAQRRSRSHGCAAPFGAAACGAASALLPVVAPGGSFTPPAAPGGSCTPARRAAPSGRRWPRAAPARRRLPGGSFKPAAGRGGSCRPPPRSAAPAGRRTRTAPRRWRAPFAQLPRLGQAAGLHRRHWVERLGGGAVRQPGDQHEQDRRQQRDAQLLEDVAGRHVRRCAGPSAPPAAPAARGRATASEMRRVSGGSGTKRSARPTAAAPAPA